MKFISIIFMFMLIADPLFPFEQHEVHISSDGEAPEPWDCDLDSQWMLTHRWFLQRLKSQRYYCGTGQNFRYQSELEA